MNIPTIAPSELKQRQDEGLATLVVMTMSPQAYDRLHIVGSQVFSTIEDAHTQLTQQSDDSLIVLYCSTAECSASYQVYHALKSLGIQDVKVLQGGLQSWANAGFPVAGQE